MTQPLGRGRTGGWSAAGWCPRVALDDRRAELSPAGSLYGASSATAWLAHSLAPTGVHWGTWLRHWTRGSILGFPDG
jgi:hypothetical protein